MTRLVLVAFLAFAAVPLFALPARAQTPPLGEIARAPLEALPGRQTDVRFLRFTLEPGTTLPADSTAGWRLVAVERGELTVMADRPVSVMSDQSIATPASSQMIVVTAGTWTLASPEATVTARNDGAEPVSVLMLELSWGDATTTAEPDSAVGVTSQLIASASLPLGGGAGELSIARAAIAPGAGRDQLALSGIELGGIEHGQATITVVAGQLLRWPGAMSDALGPPQTIVAGSSATLSPGDGYVVFSASHVTWTVTGGDPLVSLLARIATRPR
jgi:hypothetical protein